MTRPIIRLATDADLPAVLACERAAFPSAEEAELTAALLADPTAAPRLSLLAFDGERPVGHLLFTRVSAPGVEGQLLAPFAVLPEYQGRGIGRALVEDGLARLAANGVALVFTFGDPALYRRFGFVPALPHGFHPPYPLPDWLHDAWQVAALAPGRLDAAGGRAPATPVAIGCAAAIDQARYWTV